MKDENENVVTSDEMGKVLDMVIALTKDKSDPASGAMTLCCMCLASFAHGSKMSIHELMQMVVSYYLMVEQDVKNGQAKLVKSDDLGSSGRTQN
jgi:hypothetical protein